MAEMARSVKRIRPTDSHDSPDAFCKICSFPAWLMAMLQCEEKVCHLVFQVFPDGIDNFVEGIIRRGIDVQVHVV
jgi:hypothetical protein